MLKVDMHMVRELVSREDIHVAIAPSEAPAMATGEATAEFLGACCRLLDLLDSPKDIPFLGGRIQREIIYRILQGAEGSRRRPIATLGDQSRRTAKAISWIKANYAKPLRVEDLAQMAAMSVSTFHHHFRVLTTLSPLQYQKQLRLQAARGRMLTNGLDAASAAFLGRLRERGPVQPRIQPFLRPAADEGHSSPSRARRFRVINGNPRNGKPYFNTSLFSPNAVGTMESLARRPFYGPGMANFNTALYQVTKFGESKNLEIRFETFNTFNHTQFFGPNAADGNINDATFGYVTHAAWPRISQVAAKFTF